MTSKAHQFKNAMRVYATELICSTGVLGFHTSKLALCIYNKLRSHAGILSWRAFDVSFPGSNPLRSNRSGLNESNGGSRNPKFTLKVNSFWIKIKGRNFASEVLSRHSFQISRKKGSDFFDHRGTLIIQQSGVGHCSVIKDITRWREDMNFMFEWQELCGYSSCHESISRRTDHDRMCGSCRYLIAVTVHQQDA